jgi:hypothetical protein
VFGAFTCSRLASKTLPTSSMSTSGQMLRRTPLSLNTSNPTLGFSTLSHLCFVGGYPAGAIAAVCAGVA